MRLGSGEGLQDPRTTPRSPRGRVRFSRAVSVNNALAGELGNKGRGLEFACLTSLGAAVAFVTLGEIVGACARDEKRVFVSFDDLAHCAEGFDKSTSDAGDGV